MAKGLMKLIPTFSYEYSVDSSHPTDSMAFMKEVFTTHRARFIEDTDQNFTVEIRGRELVGAMMAAPDKLRINITASGSRITMHVTSITERVMYAGFFVFSLVIAMIGIQKKGEYFGVIFPIGTYGILLQRSLIPTHPAHKRLKDLLRESTLPPESTDSEESL